MHIICDVRSEVDITRLISIAGNKFIKLEKCMGWSVLGLKARQRMLNCCIWSTSGPCNRWLASQWWLERGALMALRELRAWPKFLSKSCIFLYFHITIKVYVKNLQLRRTPEPLVPNFFFNLVLSSYTLNKKIGWNYLWILLFLL